MTEDTPRTASRLHLAPLEGQRLQVTGTVMKFGCRPRFADLFEPTVLLADVQTTSGTLLMDHLWLALGLRLAAVDPQPGDVLTFAATVRAYTKNKVIQRRNGRFQYLRKTADYTLRVPCQVRVVRRPDMAPVDEPARVLGAIAELLAEQGTPPALWDVGARTHMMPDSLFAAVRRLTKRGAVTFLPDGHLLPTPTVH